MKHVNVKDVETYKTIREETLIGNMEISHLDEEKYIRNKLVQIEEKKLKNIGKIRNKGIGLKNAAYGRH